MLGGAEHAFRFDPHCCGQPDFHRISPHGLCVNRPAMPAGHLIPVMVTPPQAPRPAGGAGSPSNHCSGG
jgi:hypothetical protein